MRTRSIVPPSVLLVASALAAATPALAQIAPGAPPPLPPHAPRIQRETIRWSFAEEDSTYRNRATLGLALSSTGSSRDTLGVFVTRVVPGGPAERAGIIEGDRIGAINGVDLRMSSADVDDSYAAGVPTHRLSRAVAKLSPGNKVSLRVYSNGRYRDVSVATGRMSDVYRDRQRFMFSLGDLNDVMGPALNGMGAELERRAH